MTHLSEHLHGAVSSKGLVSIFVHSVCSQLLQEKSYGQWLAIIANIVLYRRKTVVKEM